MYCSAFKPINTVYVIDTSACLVYTVCARLRPKETLTFHTRGSLPSLSCIIVQLKSHLRPIMWEGLAEGSVGGARLRFYTVLEYIVCS